jgi:acetyltransferase-like isoleucine patch superfamily enzyme
MGIVFLFDRVKNKIVRVYRKRLFKEMTGTQHNDFQIVGNITLINKNISLGHNVTIYPDCMFFGDGLIEIGDNVDIGKGTIIYASQSRGGVTIGNNTIIAAQCYIIDMDHGIEKNEIIQNQPNTIAKVSIGKDCWLGANVTVLKGSHIGDGAIIGAKTLVKGEIESYSINVGIPARKIKSRK